MQDRQVRLWDLRTNICQGLLTVPGQQPCAAFDQQVLFLLYTVICFAVVRPAMGYQSLLGCIPCSTPFVYCIFCLQVQVLRH